MSERPRHAAPFISYRFAVTVIALLFGASAAGWVSTELVPPDVPARTEHYRGLWGAAAVKLITFLRLYDPFHSFWYGSVLALFFVVLLACVATRWRQLALRSWRVDFPAGAEELRGKTRSFEIPWRSPRGGEGTQDAAASRSGQMREREKRTKVETLRALFPEISSLIRKRGYRVISREQGDAIRFAAYSGRWRSPGTMLFHVGILVITIGGVIGTFAVRREMTFVREGTSVPFPADSTLSLRVDDFELVTTERGEIKDYISTVSILDAGGSLIASGKVEVNRPMKVRGRRIYQSQYTTDEGSFARARIGYALRGGTGNGSIDLAPGRLVSLGNGAITLTAVRFIPDFRMSPEGPFSASSLPLNPALEVDVAGGGSAETGWLFLHHPDFNKRFSAPVDLVLMQCEPVYVSGLEVSANPGSPILFAGFALATIGLMLMYFCNPRVLKGIADREALTVAAVEWRWNASFEREFGDLRETIQRTVNRRGY
jgi:cytochrome c biogenesis protein